MSAKSLHITFDKIDEFIKIYEGTGYFVLLGSERYDAISDRIRYLVGEKSGITFSISYNFAKVRIHSYNFLSIEKILSFHIVIILIKLVVNTNKNNYYLTATAIYF